jgi:uncharacterized Zn-binding protein involved in type VI secretion
MPQQVVTGAMMACTFGAAPASLIATSAPTTTVGGMPAATIMDFAPMENIPTFGVCMSLANPEVASATAAALGVLTPMPCVPNTVAPWAPGAATVTIGGFPALDNVSMCNCAWAGVISITMPGQVTTSIP